MISHHVGSYGPGVGVIAAVLGFRVPAAVAVALSAAGLVVLLVSVGVGRCAER